MWLKQVAQADLAFVVPDVGHDRVDQPIVVDLLPTRVYLVVPRLFLLPDLLQIEVLQPLSVLV